MSDSESEEELDDLLVDSEEYVEDDPTDEEIEEFEELEQNGSPFGSIVTTLTGLVNIIYSVFSKGIVTDRRLRVASRWAEYISMSALVAAVLTVVGFGVNFVVTGLSTPFLVYVQVFFGCIIVSVALLLLVIILEGGADYIQSRVR